MATDLKCCLCCNVSKQYHQLKNKYEVSNEKYDITVKYFDPMLLSRNRNALVGIILCETCWRYINDFNDFQIRVLETSTILLEAAASSFPIDTEKILAKKCMNEEEYGSFITCAMFKDHNYTSHNLQTNEEKKAEENVENVEFKNRYKYEYQDKKNKNFLDDHSKEKSTEVIPEKSTADEKDNKRYTLIKGREIDQLIAQWNPQLECDLCPTTASSFDTLRSHFLREHKTRFYIKCCNRKFYRRCILFDHIRLHLNPETHKCDICGKASTSDYNLKLHKKLVHNDIREHQCSICYKNFNYKPTLDRHFLTHATGEKNFFCEVCSKGFIKEVQLNTHVRNVHKVSGICDQCGETFYNMGSLKQHILTKCSLSHPIFSCDSCGVKLKSKEALKRHTAAYHHDGSTVYICSLCGKVSASQHGLLSHKKFVHAGNRKYKCTFCDKAFRSSTVLREHTSTHTGEDLYQCPHCPQSFKTNSNMHHHRKRMHPIEWAEARKKRVTLPILSYNNLKTQVIL